MMPHNLIFVRHGESEGNVANRAGRAGDNSLFTEDHTSRHSSRFRLTNRGREQSKWAGEQIRNMGFTIGRKYSSPYIRAMETLGYMSLGGEDCMIVDELRERDWGDLDTMAYEGRWAKYKESFKRRKRDPYLWTPPGAGGESLVSARTRLRDILGTIWNECGNMELVVCCCHGEIVDVARVAIERKLPYGYVKMKEDNKQDVPNCAILHYARKDPFNHETPLCSYLNWVRLITPEEQHVRGRTGFDWKRIIRPTFSDEELLRFAAQHPRIIDV